MHNYPLFMNMLCTCVYVPICFIYIIPIVALTTTIPREQLDIPKYKVISILNVYYTILCNTT